MNIINVRESSRTVSRQAHGYTHTGRQTHKWTDRIENLFKNFKQKPCRIDETTDDKQQKQLKNRKEQATKGATSSTFKITITTIKTE